MLPHPHSSSQEYWTYICPISKLIYMEISQLSKWSMPLNYDRQAQKALKIFTCFLSWKTYLGEFINLRVFLNHYLQASVTEQTFVYNHLSTKNIPQSEQNIFF